MLLIKLEFIILHSARLIINAKYIGVKQNKKSDLCECVMSVSVQSNANSETILQFLHAKTYVCLSI